MKKFNFTIEFMGKAVYCGEWEAEDIDQADLDINENLELIINEDTKEQVSKTVADDIKSMFLGN